MYYDSSDHPFNCFCLSACWKRELCSRSASFSNCPGGSCYCNLVRKIFCTAFEYASRSCDSFGGFAGFGDFLYSVWGIGQCDFLERFQKNVSNLLRRFFSHFYISLNSRSCGYPFDFLIKIELKRKGQIQAKNA